eukprot:Protomagalhaensia_sp_Gyna_25__1722@NODE_18_length_8108_cov_32_477630_g12_i0_p4_GENE_NODE_18_length_8108_cov_32_477630_g12_i0NODE_18_length_8108_cov_32_477630_g12_i0_p4_ORF_typecomplete_len326_score39_63DUF5397/PF17375_2/0_042_NODE_18_length_8108_cov_32_477630_g12_i067767753
MFYFTEVESAPGVSQHEGDSEEETAQREADLKVEISAENSKEESMPVRAVEAVSQDSLKRMSSPPPSSCRGKRRRTDDETLVCFRSFHPRDSESKISVWEAPTREGGRPFGTLRVKGDAGRSFVQVSTFQCPMNLVIEIEMRESGESTEYELSTKRHRAAQNTPSTQSETSVDPPESPESLRGGEDLRQLDEDQPNTESTALLRYVGGALPAPARDRRGRKSLKGGSARDAFSATELERLRQVSWPAELRRGLPVLWCPRCFLETGEFLPIQITTRVTQKGEPRVDLRHSKCLKGFGPNLFPQSLVDLHLQHACTKYSERLGPPA